MPKYAVNLKTIEHDEAILPGGFDTTTKAIGDNALNAARIAARDYFHHLDIYHPIIALEKQHDDSATFTFHIRDTGTKPMNVIARVLATVEET